MNSREFKQNLQRVQNLLSSASLLKDSQYMHKYIKPSYNRISSSKELADVYKQEVENFNYHFLLKDDSFFQFQFEEQDSSISKLRYLFLQFPYNIPCYDQFLLDNCGAKSSDIGYACLESYSQALSEADLKDSAVILRYDYSKDNYREGVHSISHIHIGFSNSIRLTVDKQLSPEVFSLFVLKQLYDIEWNNIIGNSNFQNKLKSCKQYCYSLNGTPFFSNLDKSELYFT